MILNLVFFLFGELLHVLAQLDEIARFFKEQPNSRTQIFIERVTPYIVRICVASAIFVLWLQGTLVETLAVAGISLPDAVMKVLNLHVTGAIAVLAGYAADSALGYISFFKTTVPQTQPGGNRT